MIEELTNDMRQATAEIRSLVYALRPPMLDELGLEAAIRHLNLPNSALQLEIIAPQPMPLLPAAIEVAIYRIASEAIHNVAKHAKAMSCIVSIEVETKTLCLRVSDDGQRPDLNYSGGIGIQSMEERAVELGGTFSIRPGEGGGTCVEVHLPLEVV